MTPLFKSEHIFHFQAAGEGDEKSDHGPSSSIAEGGHDLASVEVGEKRPRGGLKSTTNEGKIYMQANTAVKSFFKFYVLRAGHSMWMTPVYFRWSHLK